MNAKQSLKTWSAKDRDRYLSELSEKTFDVLIVGGGITGAGILRALGLRGISAALIEKDDFGFGTSSKSTRLAHGGVRYIINGEFSLVSEACHERDWLRGALPNLVRPVPIVMINHNLATSFFFGAYLRFYDLLSGWNNYKKYVHLPLPDLKNAEPLVNIPGTHSASRIYECIINDARLTLEIVKEGVMTGGTAVNYLEAKRVITGKGRATGVEAVDRLTGNTLVIRAKNVVNACGPWTDDLMPEEASRIIRPSKGIHIVVKRENIGNVGGLYVKSPADNRSIFVLAHGDFTYLGTTDTDYPGDLDHCYTEREEYEYMKVVVDNCFPDARFEEADILGTYAGVRPLVLDPTETTETKTSRRELIDEVYSGYFVITGGKLTIFRSMAEKLIELMAKKGAVSINKSDTNRSKERFILGLTPEEWAASNTSGKLDEKTLSHLYQNYGVGGLSIIDAVKKDSSVAHPITNNQLNIQAELDYCLEHEMITRVRDFLMRRTNLSLHQRDDHETLGRETARRMGAYLGWHTARIEQEVAEYVDIAHKNSFFLDR
ncbi:MAG: glycerol-3-phosphate dehydrogenase/oxidase [Deltaproteobacteria bacterium]|nr:glycerol-3-phosphate dehydrogenase/oxidase [Candidatus Zymogenaceae bacterium]